METSLASYYSVLLKSLPGALVEEYYGDRLLEGAREHV